MKYSISWDFIISDTFFLAFVKKRIYSREVLIIIWLMNPFLSPFLEINELYASPFKFFGNYIEALSEGVKSRVWERLLPEESHKWSVYAFSWKHTRYSRKHGPEEDIVLFYDFPHHKPLSEEEYRQFEGKELEVHIKDHTEEYYRNISTVKHVFPRYKNRFNRFLDGYLSLLTDPRIHSSHEWYTRTKHWEIKREWTVITPFALSEDKKQEDVVYHAIEDMEKFWNKERLLLIQWLENLYTTSRQIERYLELVCYFATYENKEQDIANTKGMEWIKEQKDYIMEMVESLKIIDMTTYKTWTREFLEAEHEKVRKILGKNTKRA